MGYMPRDSRAVSNIFIITRDNLLSLFCKYCNQMICVIINFYPYFRDLSHNELTNVERGAFEYLMKLEKLKLDHNQIANIADGTFNFTTNLRILYV